MLYFWLSKIKSLKVRENGPPNNKVNSQTKTFNFSFDFQLFTRKMATKINIIFRQVLILFLLSGTFSAHAQLKYGFKTGLNFARIIGPSETNDAGADLETWKNTVGFHIGMTLAYKFTDNFGLRGELLYSKRGAKYAFEGQSYRIFNHSTGSVLTRGTARYLININNSYLDLPLMVYGRFGKFEISGGAYLGLLLQSVGEGSLRYSGKTILGNDAFINPNKADTELNFNLNYNYRRDAAGAGSSKSNDEMPLSIKVDGFISETPETLGAYYDFSERKARLYNALDYGLVGGISFYISSTLYLSGRVQYGLADLTNQDADLSKSKVENNKDLIYRDDKDRNFTIQASVGFSF
jgi:hypothetical protein